MTKHSNKISNAFVFLIAAVLIGGCGKEKVKKDFIARVNNSYLTKEELSSLMNNENGKNFYREEVIRDWINREVLYQEAVKKGILKEDDFKRIVEDEKKELAVSLFLRKYYDSEKPSYEQKDIQDYYDKHQDEFKLFYDSYYINLVDFNNEDDAIKFRSLILESDWNKALNIFKNESSIIKVQTGVLLNDFQIYPATLQRIVTDLNPQEVSIVLNYLPGHYAVVQELQKYGKGTIPPFNVVKDEAEKRFLADSKDEFLKSYIRDLYSNNDIEVKN